MNITLLIDDSRLSLCAIHFKQELLTLLSNLDCTLTTYELSQNSLHHCIGCFDCWVKTPGICVINDLSRSITESVINSDWVILVTPIIYGGFSSPVKQAIDRMIPLISPFFTIKSGEMHHQKRYYDYPKFINIGYGANLSLEEKDTFEQLQFAMQRNFYIPTTHTYILKSNASTSPTLSHMYHILTQTEGGNYHA